MKLAEALVLRAETQKRIEQLRERLKLSALVQEGDQPPEDPQQLMEEMERLLQQLQAVIVAINHTNTLAKLSDGRTLTHALAERDVLRVRYSVFKSVADSASRRVDHYSRSEIRSVPTVDVRALRQQTDEVAQQYRELDMLIQSINWTVDLIE